MTSRTLPGSEQRIQINCWLELIAHEEQGLPWSRPLPLCSFVYGNPEEHALAPEAGYCQGLEG